MTAYVLTVFRPGQARPFEQGWLEGFLPAKVGVGTVGGQGQSQVDLASVFCLLSIKAWSCPTRPWEVFQVVFLHYNFPRPRILVSDSSAVKHRDLDTHRGLRPLPRELPPSPPGCQAESDKDCYPLHSTTQTSDSRRQHLSLGS